MYKLLFVIFFVCVTLSIPHNAVADSWLWTLNIKLDNKTRFEANLDKFWDRGLTHTDRPAAHIGPYSGINYNSSAPMFQDIHTGAGYILVDLKRGIQLTACQYDIDSHYNWGWHGHMKSQGCDNPRFYIHTQSSQGGLTLTIHDTLDNKSSFP